MKNKIIIALIAVVMVVCSLTLVACSNKDADIITNYIFEQEGQIVESDFVLPLTISEKKAEWTSNSQYVTLTKREENWLASVSYPDKGIEDVTLTLTIGSASKDFVVRVKAIDEITFMDNYVFKQDKGTVAANFALDRTYEFKGKTCNISWSVDQAYELYIKISNDGNQCLVFEQSESTPVVIKATFEYQGSIATKSYSMNVYQQLEGLELVDFWYSNTGVSIEMSGYVVLIGTEYSSTYNNVTLYMVNDDYTAGYYLFRVKTTDEHAANLVPGAHITVTGTTNTNYNNGLIETKAGGNLVVDKDWEVPYDASKAVKAVDEEVIGDLPATIYNESRLVSLTNWKVKSHCAESELSSGNFTLMTITKGGVSVNIGISMYLEGAYTKGDDTHKALLALLNTYPVDSTLNVQGIFSNFNGAWEIMPLSVDDVTAGGVADADDKKDYDGLKVADAVKAVNAKIAELGLNQRITSNLECELLSSSNGVNISYYIRKSNSAVLDGAKLTVTPGNPETTAVQVKYSINDFETVQYIYISSLIPTAASMIEEIKLPDSIIGEIDLPTIEGAEIVWEILTGDTNSLTIDAENNKLVPVLGDKAITYIISAKLTYNGQERTKKFVIVLKGLSDLADHAGTEEDPYTIADVNKIASNLSTSATKENFYIQAYIKELGSWSEQYGNYNSGYLGDFVSDKNALYAYILKGIDKGTLNVGDKVICSVESLVYYSDMWEIKSVQVTKIVSSASAAEPEGRKVILSNAGKYITSEVYVYTSSSGSTKDELVLSSDASKAQAIIIVENEDKSVSLITPDWKYLYCNGTNVNFVDEAGEYTLFNLVEVEGGYNIVSVNAKYKENAQYLQVFSGYLTCYSYQENNASRYLIGIEDYADVEPEPEPAGPEFEHAGTEADPYTIADVNKMFDAEYTDAKNFYLDAYIVEVSSWSDQYCNYSYAKLAASADDDNKVSVYVFKGVDINTAKAGDHVICKVSSVSQYNDAWQISFVEIVEYVEDGSQGGEIGGEDNPPAGEPSIEAAKPEAGNAYVIGFVRDSKIYYVDGEMAATYYFNTVESKDSAIKVYVESVEGGYNIYVSSDNGVTKKYINVTVSGTYVNSVYQDTAATVWTWDDTLKTLKTLVNSEDYVLGTTKSKTFTTLGPVKADGDANYIAQFVFVEKVESGSQGDQGDDPVVTTPYIYYANASGDIGIEFDAESKQYIYYLYGYEETRGTASENEDGYYEFYYARGNGHVQFAVDGDSLSLIDSLIGEDEIYLSKSEFNQGSGDGEDEGNDTPVIGDGATFTADQQGTYTASVGVISEVSITISESKVHLTHLTGGYDDDYSAELSNGKYTITTSNGDTLSFAFADGSLSCLYNYFYSDYEFTANKQHSTPIAEKGSKDNPYTADELWDAYGAHEQGWVSDKQVYLKGVISSVPSLSNGAYSFNFENSKDANIQGYSVVLGDLASVLYQNDEIVIYGYVTMYYNNVLEVGYIKDIENSNPTLVSRVIGEAHVTITENENVTVTLSKENGHNGDEFTFTVEVKNGAIIDAVQVNKVAVNAESDGSYKSIMVANTVVSVISHLHSEEISTESLTWELASDKGTLSSDSKELSFVNGDFSVVYNNGTSSSNIYTTATDHIRCYQGGYLEISANNEKKIKSITITCTGSNKNIKDGYVSTDGVMTEIADNVCTISHPSGFTSVRIDANAQFRVKTIVIEYFE